MKEIILFCGAPADIQYALAIYEKNKDRTRISIFCLNVEEMYQFLQSRCPSLKQLFFIPYEKGRYLRIPHLFFKEYFRIRKLFRLYFTNTNNSDIYFFSDKYDWILFYFISKLYIHNTITYLDHSRFGHLLGMAHGAKTIIYKILHFIMTGIWFIVTIHNGNRCVTMPLKRYNIQSTYADPVSKDVYSKYIYKPQIDGGRSVLFIESNEAHEIHLPNEYNRVISEFAQLVLNNDAELFIKPHPRLGYSTILNKYNPVILPKHIPGEFIDYNGFSLIIGLSSTLLAEIAYLVPDKTLSIQNLFTFVPSELKIHYHEYLMIHSKEKMRFVNSMEEMGIILKNALV